MSENEPVDFYNENLKKIGVKSRREVHRNGDWHLNFHCWFVTHENRGSVLFQIRSKSKPTYPNLLDSTVGGHYRANEKTAEIVREVEEEIGIKAAESDLRYLGRRIDIGSTGRSLKREISNVYFFDCRFRLSEFKTDPAEITGLVEIPISGGFKLFSGEEKFVKASRLKRQKSSSQWQRSTIRLALRDFVPKVDSYYMTLFIMAKRFLGGKKYLSI